MNTTTGIARPTPPLSPKQESLQKAALQLEGVFVEQLFKAMRSTVPDGGMTDGGAGEDTFTSLLDQHLAEQVPGDLGGSLSRAILHQLNAGHDVPEGTQP